MIRVVRSVVLVFILIVVSSVTSHAWYYYTNAEESVWEEISMESETLPAGTIISALPNGARSVTIERTQYFVSGRNWFLPIISDDGVKYQVVFAPV